MTTAEGRGSFVPSKGSDTTCQKVEYDPIELCEFVADGVVLTSGAQRPGHDQHDRGEHRQYDHELDQGFAGAGAAAPPRAGYGAVARRRTSAGIGHSAIRPPIAVMIAPSQIHVTSGDTIKRKLTGHGWVT